MQKGWNQIARRFDERPNTLHGMAGALHSGAPAVSVYKSNSNKEAGQMNKTKAREIQKIAAIEGISYRRLKKDIKAAISWLSTLPQNVAIFPKKRKPGEGMFDFKARRKSANERKRLNKKRSML